MSNLGWAAHVTHHSSNDYNLSTALRQGVGESMVGGRCNCVVCVGGGQCMRAGAWVGHWAVAALASTSLLWLARVFSSWILATSASSPSCELGC